jgi:CheY-like chemotaxis protein
MSEPTTRPRLLIVESDESVRRVLGRVLSPRFEITPLGLGMSALGRLKEERFDVMLLDLAVKDINAIELLRQVRAIAPQLPIIATTPLPADDLTALDEHDVLACLAKPFNTPELRAPLDRAIAQALKRA